MSSPKRSRLVEEDYDGVPTESSKYNPADFIIPAQDHQGHSERIWCRVQPQVDRQLDVILRSKKFPYRTKGDIIRHATVAHIKKLENMEPMPGFMGRADAINAILRDELYYHEFQSMFERMSKVIDMHLGRNGTGEARRLVAIIKNEILKIEEPYWAKKAMEELQTRFGHLTKDVPRGKLHSTEAPAEE